MQDSEHQQCPKRPSECLSITSIHLHDSAHEQRKRHSLRKVRMTATGDVKRIRGGIRGGTRGFGVLVAEPLFAFDAFLADTEGEDETVESEC